MFQAIVLMHLTTAVLCCTIAVLAIRGSRRARSWRPIAGWAFAAFVTTSAITSIQRAGIPWLPHWHGWLAIGTALDAITALMLAAVFVQAARQHRVVLLVVERAQRSAEEYERAHRDYEQLLRHRIGNPLTVVQGVAHTLANHPDLSEEVRTELLVSLLDSADALATVSLDPACRRPEEQDLQPLPDQTLIAA